MARVVVVRQTGFELSPRGQEDFIEKTNKAFGEEFNYLFLPVGVEISIHGLGGASHVEAEVLFEADDDGHDPLVNGYSVDDFNNDADE